MHLLPPPGLTATLSPETLDHKHTSRFNCEWVSPDPDQQASGSSRLSRRGFLVAAGAALCAFGATREAHAMAAESGSELTSANLSPVQSAFTPKVPGVVEKDFWEQPRILRLQRNGTGKVHELVYWEKGKLVPSAYWQVCALLRDVRANTMTSIDPALLDVLRGVAGYYEAWGWPSHMVITSGFRTQATNRALSREGSAKDSFHVKGRAVDMYIPGVPPRDVSLLGMHMKQGGVGFYPTKGFTHLDTGSLRTWRG